MLTILPLSRLQHRQEVLNSFDFSQQTWVVSDLRSKRQLQSYLLAQLGFYEELQALRAQDFWKKLLRRWDPSYRIASQNYLEQSIES